MHSLIKVPVQRMRGIDQGRQANDVIAFNEDLITNGTFALTEEDHCHEGGLYDDKACFSSRWP